MIISLVTAIVEFCILFYLIFLFTKNKNKKILLAGVMVLFLASYQLSEYMLCNTAHSELWARFGFAVYTFIPAIAFNFFLSLSNKKNVNWVYIIPLFFALIALVYPNFIISSVCKVFYVSVSSLVFKENIYLLVAYLGYYSLFSILGVYIFSKHATSTLKDCTKTRIATAFLPLSALFGVIFFIIYNLKEGIIHVSFEIFAILFMAVLLSFLIFIFLWTKSYAVFLNSIFILVVLSFLVDVVLYVLLTQFSYDFSSVWCHFAFLYSVSCLLYALSIKVN